MARGFESKDVEFQQSEASRAVEKAGKGAAMNAEEQDVQRQRQTLELALTSTRAQLNASRNPHYRRMLDDAIRALEQQLDKLRK